MITTFGRLDESAEYAVKCVNWQQMSQIGKDSDVAKLCSKCAGMGDEFMADRSKIALESIGNPKRDSRHGKIVRQLDCSVKHGDPNNYSATAPKNRTRRKTRRQSHGSAWHWKQTDSWYYTLPGCKKRVPLFDEDGNRIRGLDNKKAAQLALARVKLGRGWSPEAPPASPDEWIVAKVCSEYLQYCERGVANGTVSKGHRDGTDWMLTTFASSVALCPWHN
jgi:hypothetical protein